MSEERAVQLKDPRMKQQEFSRVWWVITVEEGTTRKDIQKSEFWTQVAIKLKPYDRLEIRSDDGMFFAEYLVMTAGRTAATVKELSWIELSSKSTPVGSEYYEKWRGPHHLWCVLRLSDNEVMATNYESKDLAIAQIPIIMKKMET
jgi:hypothetical protein